MQKPAHALLEKLTIAIPVYNDERYIAATIESCLAEAGHIVLCDNSSTDGTGAICAEFAKKYPHVTHIRHAENIGAFENFRRPLFDCATEYFCWVGSHDLLGKDYAQPLLEAMEKDPAIALGVGIIQHIGENGAALKTVTRSRWANRSKDRSPLERVGACVTHLRDCFMFYGVFRTALAREAWFDTPCLGFDRAMLVRTAAAGKIIYEPQSVFYARDFNVSRDSKEDQERRILVLAPQAPAKNHFARNRSMIDTVLNLAKTPEDLTLALKIIDKINRRHQARRYYQKLRLLKITGIILLAVLFILTLLY